MRVPFIIDKYGKTPLHYLLAHPPTGRDFTIHNNAFRYILQYLEENVKTSLNNCRLVMDSLSSLLPLILSAVSPSLSVRFFNVCYQRATSPHGIPLPEFGGNNATTFQSSESYILKPESLKTIYKEGQDSISFNTLMLRFDYSITSEDMFNTILAVNSTDNQDILTTHAITCLIDYLWGPAKKYHLTVSVLYSVLMILLSVFFVLGQSSVVIETIITVLSSFLLVLELLQWLSLRSKYFESIWNYADITFFLLVICKMVRCFINGDEELYGSWVFVALFLVGYVRWVSYLQIFEPTSKPYSFISSALIYY